MRRSCFSGFASFAAFVVLVAQNPQGGMIRGTATLAADSNEALPGVEVTATGAGTRMTTVTDAAGRFELSGLPGGTYELRAELGGFSTAYRAEVRVSVANAVVVNFAMEFGALEELMWVVPGGGLREAYSTADAVVHLRIVRSLEAQPWRRSPKGGGGVVGTEHEAHVLDSLKIDPVHGPSASDVQFVQLTAGSWSDGGESADGMETAYSVGDEYVAFLVWDPGIDRFRRLAGPIFMFPVRDGRVFWNRRSPSDLPELRNGMTVGSFFAVLRALPGGDEYLHGPEQQPQPNLR